MRSMHSVTDFFFLVAMQGSWLTGAQLYFNDNYVRDCLQTSFKRKITSLGLISVCPKGMKEKKERGSRGTKHSRSNTKLKQVVTCKVELPKSGKSSLHSRIFLTQSQLPLEASPFFFSLKKPLWRRGCQRRTAKMVTPT